MKTYLLTLFGILLLTIKLSAQNDTTTIIIMHTNDMHGYIDKYAKMKPIIDSIRENNKNTILVSAGDLFSGNPYVDKYIKPGYPMIDIMNSLEYKISALGNHEFDYGQEIMEKRFKQAKFPVICANINTQKSIVKNISPYKILTIGNKKIAFISALKITKKGYPQTLPSKLKNLKFYNPIKTIKKYKFLKDSADIVIGLTHLGIKTDKQLAKSINFIDVIIGGHSHTIIDTSVLVNNILICQAGSYNNYLGVLTIKTINKKVIYKHDTLISIINKTKIDNKIAQKIKEYNNNKSVNKVIGYLSKTLVTPFEIADVFNNAFVDATHSDIAFMNFGGIRIDTLKKGNIRFFDIYSVDPFNNELMTAELTSNEIKGIIKYSYNMRNKPSIKSNLNYKIEKNKDGSFKSVKFSNPLKNNKLYKVVINSYMATAFKFKGSNKFKKTGVFSNNALVNFFKKQR